jgi:hypothetical protein
MAACTWKCQHASAWKCMACMCASRMHVLAWGCSWSEQFIWNAASDEEPATLRSPSSVYASCQVVVATALVLTGHLAPMCLQRVLEPAKRCCSIFVFSVLESQGVYH